MTFQELKDFINVTPTFSGDLNSQKAAFSAVVDKIAEVLYQYLVSPVPLIVKGADTAANVDAATPATGWLYKIATTGGDLNDGTDDAVTVAVSDYAFYDGTIWHKVDDDKTAAQINSAVSSSKPAYGEVYKIKTTGGTLTEGSLVVAVGDYVMWNGNQFVKLLLPVNSATYGIPMYYMGAETAVNLNAYVSPVNGMVFTVSSIATSATVGSLTTAVGDAVIYSGGAWCHLAKIDEAE